MLLYELVSDLRQDLGVDNDVEKQAYEILKHGPTLVKVMTDFTTNTGDWSE